MPVIFQPVSTHMTRFLNQPVPFKYSYTNLIQLALFVSGAVFLFLFLFRPVGISKGIKVDLIWACLIHGMVGGLLFLFHYGLLTRFAKKTYWNRAREIGVFLSLVVIAGMVNFCISHQINYDYQGFEWEKLGREIYNTFLVASIPMGLIWLWFHKTDVVDTASVSNQSQAMNMEDESVFTKSLNISFPNDETLEININELVFAQVQGNYVEFYVWQNNEIKKHIRRSTIKHLEEQVANFNTIVKTHRSFLVNLDKVKGYQGNASGLQLDLDNCNQQVPVSRSRVSEIQERLAPTA